VSRKSTEERKEQILEESLKILHEEGKGGLTIGNIAERIDVSEAAVYRHFDSKQEIVHGMAEKVFSHDLVEEEIEVGEPRQMLESLVSGIFSCLEENPYVTAMFFREELFTEHPEVEKIFQDHGLKIKSSLEKMVEKGKRKDLFSQEIEPEVFSRIFIGSVTTEVIEWRQKDFSYPLSERAVGLSQQLSRILKEG